MASALGRWFLRRAPGSRPRPSRWKCGDHAMLLRSRITPKALEELGFGVRVPPPKRVVKDETRGPSLPRERSRCAASDHQKA